MFVGSSGGHYSYADQKAYNKLHQEVSVNFRSLDKMNDVRIIRIPLADEDRINPVRQFPKMPILYLELIENKIKIKPEFINKLYEPSKGVISIKSVAIDEKQDSVHEDTTAAAVASAAVVIPPTLKELQDKNPDEPIMKKEFRYPQVDDEETMKKRNEVHFQYQVLKRMHPNADIPEFKIHSDPNVYAKTYEMIAKKQSLDTNVENWKRYMIMFVMLLEVLLGKMSFDVEGFAQQQLVQMNTYDSLLVEMAEKSYTPHGTSKWPVEARLCMMLTVNMAMFIVCKMIKNRTGTDLIGKINQQLGVSSVSSAGLMRPPPSSSSAAAETDGPSS